MNIRIGLFIASTDPTGRHLHHPLQHYLPLYAGCAWNYFRS